MQTFASGEANVCHCTGRRGLGCLDAPEATRYTAGMSTPVSIPESGSMPETGGSDQRNQTVTKYSPPDTKIELFRSLFRGRMDV
jgi:hypothetical protein